MQYFVTYQQHDKLVNTILDDHPCQYLDIYKEKEIAILFWSKIPEDLNLDLPSVSLNSEQFDDVWTKAVFAAWEKPIPEIGKLYLQLKKHLGL